MEVEFLLSDPQEKLIESFVTNDEKNSNKASSALNTLLVKISKKETTLLSTIKDLHSFLTSTNQIHRSRGLLLLFNILDRCQDLTISSQEFVSLYEFFISKMTDIAVTLEALKCIYNLLVRNTSKKIFDDDKKLFDDFIGVLESKSFHTPAYAQEVRLNVYLILKHLTQTCEKLCVDLDDKFLRIILDTVEEEQDPRNLMISFKLIHFLLDRLPSKTVGLFKNDIFEILSMYYPITFKPPENDIFKISPEDLEGELNMCLCNNHLLEMTVEMTFDKVSASQDSAKIACLNTLELLVQKNFNREFMSKYATAVWEKVKPVYYHSTSNDVEEKCLKFLEKFLKQPLSLAFEKGVNTGILEDISSKIIGGSLADIQKGTTTQNASKAIKLLVLLSSVSEDLSVIILNKFAHIFTDKYDIQNPQESQAWLEYFFRLYDSWDKHFKGKSDPKGNLFGLKLDVFKIAYLRLRDIINSSLSSESARIIALKIYAHATNMLYRSVEYHEGYADICNLMNQTSQTPLMKECVSDALIISSQGNEVAVVDETIENVIGIFEKVYCNQGISQEGSLEYYFSHNTKTMFYVLKTFSSIVSSGKQVLNLLLKFLVGQLQNLTIGFDNLLLAIKTLNQVVTNVKEQGKKNVVTAEELDNISGQIFDLLVANNGLETGLLGLKKADETKYLSLKNDFKNILAQVSGSVKFTQQAFGYFIDALNKELYNGGSQLKILGWALETIKENPYNGADGKEALKVFVSTIESKNFSGVAKESIFSLGRILRSFTNKSKDNDLVIKLLAYLGKVYKESNDTTKLTLYCYAIKGLIAKGDRTGFQCMLQFLNTALPYISEGKDIQTFTVCYRVLIKDIKKNFAEYNISTTSKQRLFSMIFPYSYTLFQKGRDENNLGVKDFFTAVIMYLITQISFKILKASFQQILPIILENIAKLNEQQLDNMEYSIDFISKVLEEREEISEKVEDLASNLLVILGLFREKEREIPEDFYVRNAINIIKSLIKIARFPLTNIKKLRNEVLEALEPEKANRRRAVRKYVVACINEWHAI